MSDVGRPGEVRRVIANIVLTLDDRTTGPAGEFDMSYIAPHGISNQMRDALVETTHATTVLLGRKNYEGFGAYWPAVTHAADAEVRDRRFARWLDEVDKVVFSTRLERAEWNNSSIADASHIVGGGSRLFDDTLSPSTWSLTSATPTDTGAIRLVYDRPWPPAPKGAVPIN